MNQYDFCLRLERGVNWPEFKFTPESVCFEENQIDEYTKVVKHRIVSPTDQIILEYINKFENETVVSNGQIIHDQTLAIEQIYVDNIQIDINVVSTAITYLPVYRQDFVVYCQTNNIELLIEPHYATKFWHNGEWKFLIKKDFWAWYYQQRVAKNESNNYFGQSTEQIKTKLAKLKELL